MKTLTSVFILLATYQAYAAGPKPVVVFKDKQGQTITLEQAWQVTAKGDVVYRCQPVKATVNKSGTSISFKVVK